MFDWLSFNAYDMGVPSEAYYAMPLVSLEAIVVLYNVLVRMGVQCYQM